MLWPLGLIECFIMAIAAMWFLEKVGNQQVTNEVFSVSVVAIFCGWLSVNYWLHRPSNIEKWASVWGIFCLLALPFWPIVIPAAFALAVLFFVGMAVYGFFVWVRSDLMPLPKKLALYVING